MDRKFQINPGPLKVVPQAQRDGWRRKLADDPNYGRCEATRQDGFRCLRNVKGGGDYCWQHQGLAG